jgi:hypothetical protein
MTDRPTATTMAPLVPEMPQTRVRTDGGATLSDADGANDVHAETDAPLVPDLS